MRCLINSVSIDSIIPLTDSLFYDLRVGNRSVTEIISLEPIAFTFLTLPFMEVDIKPSSITPSAPSRKRAYDSDLSSIIGEPDLDNRYSDYDLNHP